MGKLEPASDPSMEDILASIRRIIADDDGPRKPPAAPTHLSVVERPAPAGPIIREPAAPLAVPPVRFDAPRHTPAEPAPVASTVAPGPFRTLAETGALPTASPSILPRPPIAATASAAAVEHAASLARSAVAIIAPATTRQQAAAPIRVETIAAPRAEPPVAPAGHMTPAHQAPSPAFPQRSGALSPAAIELEVARLLASPRPPAMPLRPALRPAATAPTAPAAPPQILAPQPAPVEARAVPTPPPAALPPASAVATASPSTATAPAGKPSHGLLSPNSDAAVRTAFDQLADTMFSREARSLEDVVKDMMRPMLRDWLDDNLPPLVERLVREEIQRVSRGRK